ncbi:magnetosome protein MamC [Maridesulfovibrio bastinii]|uniref:magnetosome protein MamC n=1 Tax=Maridesulfovibrio bastinii TaxID=47157 RepID=UPI000422E5FA|nr:magnetosome protein MamC [Maridesulfovibrio bastinii]
MNKIKKINSSTASGSYVLKNALLGAVIGGAVSAFQNAGKVKKGDMTKDEAIKDCIKEAGTMGVSTGTASAVVNPLPLGPIGSALGFVAVASGTKYMLNKAFPAPQPEIPVVEEITEEKKAEEEKVEDKIKPAAKKTTKKKAAKSSPKSKATEKTEE